MRDNWLTDCCAAERRDKSGGGGEKNILLLYTRKSTATLDRARVGFNDTRRERKKAMREARLTCMTMYI